MFLLFVNTIILTHAVIPHHYHDGVYVSTATCNVHEESPYDHCPLNHEECFLTKAYVRPDNDRAIFQAFDLGIDLDLPALLPDYPESPIEDVLGLPFRQKPYLLSRHTEYVARSLGSRAPPVC